MSFKKWALLLSLGLAFLPLAAQDEEEECDLEPDPRAYSANFSVDDCRFRNRYHGFERNHPYWSMEPGWQVVLEGEEDGEALRVEITVLNETEWVAGVRTRVIEEREFENGELKEVSRNFFAICHRTNDIYYFGEDVDNYEDGEIVDHDSAWRAGVDGATPGVIFPGTPLVGSRFYQEIAPDIAEDRAELTEITTVEIDGVSFENVIVFDETSRLDSPCDVSIKWYAPGIGMIRDENLFLVEAGFLFRLPPDYGFKR